MSLWTNWKYTFAAFLPLLKIRTAVHGLQSLQQLKNTNIKLSETQYINGVEQQQKLSSKNDH